MSNTVHFSNAGRLELDFVRLMGVSVKDDSAIGRFGTGLKYGIATLLRTGHEIHMQIGGQHYDFTTKTKTLRGKDFEIVCMNDEELGFTTALGRDWKVWQAFREFYSNCLDEKGKITINPMMADTVISITGKEIMEAYYDRAKIFIQTEPIHVMYGMEVHPGRSNGVFYRGVRVLDLPKETVFTYNITDNLSLSEDRTAGVYMVNYLLARHIARIPNRAFFERLYAGYHRASGVMPFYEYGLEMSTDQEVSEEFLDFFTDNENVLLPISHRLLAEKYRPKKREDKRIQPEGNEQETIQEAIDNLRKLNAIVRPEDVIMVETLGPGVLAMQDGLMTLVTRQCVANGVDFLTITLYEEWIHRTHGYADETRGMQQFLFDKILWLMKKLED